MVRVLPSKVLISINLTTDTGTCQFPTLGFVVDRYFRVRNFVPETFWNLQVIHKREGINVTFNWKRVHLFDRMIVTILFERCIAAKVAKVTRLQTRPTSKWKPLPLTTVELQKCGSRFLRLDSQRIMKVDRLDLSRYKQA
jgi:DNA topoisomerase-3